MNRKLFTAGASVAAVLAFATASASATVIGGSSQSSDQGVNSTQQANAPSATGEVIVVGGGAPAGPPSTQLSVNALSDGQAVGSAGGGDAFISPTGTGPTQSSKQGVNSTQVSAGGAIGLQISANILGNSQIVGGDQSCVIAPATCVSSVIIGTPTQASEQGVNSNQSADGGVTTGDSITTPTVVLNGLAGPTSQFSFNIVDNGQLVLG
jgi:hypothetical protein